MNLFASLPELTHDSYVLRILRRPPSLVVPSSASPVSCRVYHHRGHCHVVGTSPHGGNVMNARSVRRVNTITVSVAGVSVIRLIKVGGHVSVHCVILGAVTSVIHQNTFYNSIVQELYRLGKNK